MMVKRRHPHAFLHFSLASEMQNQVQKKECQQSSSFDVARLQFSIAETTTSGTDEGCSNDSIVSLEENQTLLNIKLTHQLVGSVT